MKAVYYTQAGKGSVTDIPNPVCGDDEVLIEIKACSICKGAELGHAGTGTGLAKYPVVPGHEFAGYVSAIGKNVTLCKVGDRVTADNTAPCGKCYYCQKGDFLHCEIFGSLGHNINGGFAEYAMVKENKIFLLPNELSFEEGCMTEAVACCIHAMDRLDVKYGENIVVIGDGANGILLTELLTSSNANRVTLIGRHEEKIGIAKKYGADVILNKKKIDLTSEIIKKYPKGVDAVVDATGNNGMIAMGLKMLKFGGRLLQYSVTGEGEKVEIDCLDFFARELTYYATSAQVFCFDRALDAIKSKKVHLEELVTSRYCLTEYFDAIDSLRSDRSQIKIVIVPGGNE